MMTSQVANTILQQLGASRFLAMTGARNLVAGEDTLQFDLPRNASKVTKVQIKLASSDLYTMAFYRWNARDLSMAPTQPAMNGVYAEDLASTFSRVTGLDVSL
jgi:hypothetical protein